MARETKYTCDKCGKPIINVYGPLFVTIASEIAPQVNKNLELCSFACLEKYAHSCIYIKGDFY